MINVRSMPLAILFSILAEFTVRASELTCSGLALLIKRCRASDRLYQTNPSVFRQTLHRSAVLCDNGAHACWGNLHLRHCMDVDHTVRSSSQVGLVIDSYLLWDCGCGLSYCCDFVHLSETIPKMAWTVGVNSSVFLPRFE